MSYTGSQAIVCPAGSSFGYAAAVGGTYAALSSEVTKIGLPSNSAGKVDVTNMNSKYPNSEEKADWLTLGDCEIEANLTPTDFKLCKTQQNVQQFFQIVVTAGDGTTTAALTGTFPGYISEVTGDVPVKGKSSMKIKVHLTGQDTWA